MSLIAHSQQGIDSVVVLSKEVAVRVLQDLDRLTHCDSVNTLNELKMDNLIKQTRIQDRIILGHQEQIFNFKQISSNKDSVILVNNDKVIYWEKQYKKQKRQKFLIGGIGILLIILVGI